jgi:Flp pilus assembly protein TadB
MTIPGVRGEDDRDDNRIVVDWRRHQEEIRKEEKRRSKLTPRELRVEDAKRECESKARAIEQQRFAQRHRRQQRIKIFLSMLFALACMLLLLIVYGT